MPVSKCDPILKDAFRGIELNYKLNSTIASLPKNQKFSAEQLEGYLKKQGVSPYEIKASRLFDNFRGDNRTFTAGEWDQMNLGDQMFENKFTAGHESDSYAEISLGRKGEDPDADYRVKEFMATKQNKPTNLTHEFGDTMVETNELQTLKEEMENLRDEAGMTNLLDLMKTDKYKELNTKIRILEESDAGYTKPYHTQSQLGWNRVHQDEINGKPTTVLNELQSDWMQAERGPDGKPSGLVFESKAKKPKLREKSQEEIDFSKKFKVIEDKMNELRNQGINYDNDPKGEYEELVDQLVDLEDIRAERGYANAYEDDYTPASKIVADFPMKPEKFQQLMIVDAINESIENGTNRVAIPIQRENELVGTAGVTKVYENLDKQLKVIQKKLGKSNLELKISREDYDNFKFSIDDINYGPEEYYAKESHMLNLLEFSKDRDEVMKHYKTIRGNKEYSKEFRDSVGNNLSKEAEKPSNELHVIEVVQKPNTPVRWDVYGLISALGLTSSAMNMEAHQQEYKLKAGEAENALSRKFNISKEDATKALKGTRSGKGQKGETVKVDSKGYPLDVGKLPNVVKRQESEGNEDKILKAHKPTNRSGWTIGYGYDKSGRTLGGVIKDFKAAGIPIGKAKDFFKSKDISISKSQATKLGNVAWLGAYQTGVRIGLPMNKMPQDKREKVMSLLYRGDIKESDKTYRAKLFKLAKSGSVEEIDKAINNDSNIPEALANRWKKYK